ncbi:MAG: protein kinase [Pseudomonadota bacterium]
MSLKVLIVDAQEAFRRRLLHHVSIVWPDALISDYDPGQAGALDEGFSGAGNDLVLLGDRLAEMDALATLKRFKRLPGFPPVVMFARTGGPVDAARAVAAGAFAVLERDTIDHAELAATLRDAVNSRRNTASTASLFLDGDRGTLAMRGYRLIRKLSTGAFSSVYLTENTDTGDVHVLKVVRQVPDSSDGMDGVFSRFLQEYELISSLHHPNIVEIVDFGVGDDHAYIAMEYFPGGDLRVRIRRGMAADSVISAVTQIAGALAAMHSVGILHRDLKPGNVMCRDDGSFALIDFGLAKQLAIAGEITGTGEIFGTPYYMSPEQGHGRRVDERGDIYSLGVMFYEMLTGQKPFLADSAMGIIYHHSHAERPRLPAEHRRWQGVLDRMLAIEPDERFQAAADVVAALQA